MCCPRVPGLTKSRPTDLSEPCGCDLRWRKKLGAQRWGHLLGKVADTNKVRCFQDVPSTTRWFIIDNPIYKWMMTGGTSMSRNLHDCLLFNPIGSYIHEMFEMVTWFSAMFSGQKQHCLFLAVWWYPIGLWMFWVFFSCLPIMPQYYAQYGSIGIRLKIGEKIYELPAVLARVNIHQLVWCSPCSPGFWPTVMWVYIYIICMCIYIYIYMWPIELGSITSDLWTYHAKIPWENHQPMVISLRSNS